MAKIVSAGPKLNRPFVAAQYGEIETRKRFLLPFGERPGRFSYSSGLYKQGTIMKSIGKLIHENPRKAFVIAAPAICATFYAVGAYHSAIAAAVVAFGPTALVIAGVAGVVLALGWMIRASQKNDFPGWMRSYLTDPPDVVGGSGFVNSNGPKGGNRPIKRPIYFPFLYGK